MRNTILRCGSCGGSLAVPGKPGAGLLPCPACGLASKAWRFPALFRETRGATGQRILEEGQSSCMNHPEKQAVNVCEACGKFLCALCDVDWNGEHLCPACIEHRRRAGGTYRTRYIHYDTVALAIVVLSLPMMIVFGIGGLIAPIALFVCWRYWREPWRPVPHGKATMILAVLLAGLVFISWLAVIVFFIASL